MVRLKATSPLWDSSQLSFQFQYGSIKRPLVLMFRKSCSGFNSNMVRLKVKDITSDYPYFVCFNSNMVRLKVFFWFLSPFALPSFNSNMVRLKEHISSVHNTNFYSFNSNMVRLKAKSLVRQPLKKLVSIPIWFD